MKQFINFNLAGEFLENLQHVQLEDLEVMKDYMKSVEKYITTRTQLIEIEVKIKALRQAIAYLKSKKSKKDARFKLDDVWTDE